MTKKPTGKPPRAPMPDMDPFKRGLSGTGFPPGASASRQNVYPAGPDQGKKPTADNGRELLHGVGTSGSVRVQNGSIRSVGGPEGSQSTISGFVNINSALATNPPDNFFDCKGGTALIVQEFQGWIYPGGPPPLTVQFYLNQNEIVSDEIALTTLAEHAIVRGINFPTPPATGVDIDVVSPRFCQFANGLFRLNFDRINLRCYSNSGPFAVRAIYCTGQADIAPLANSWTGP